MEYIVVIGAKMSNKGSQSMVFQIVSEMYKRFPDKKVVALMNHKNDLVKSMNEIYNFEIISFRPADILYLYGGVQTVAGSILGRSRENVRHIQSVLHSTCMAFDVSGYSLSSNWSGANSLKYLYQIAILKKYQIPVVVMPQSFGPFEYSILYKPYILSLCTKLLPYANIIFAREQFSYNIIKEQFNLSNVILSKDMVLLGKEVNKAAIFKSGIKLREYSVSEGCIAIVPNEKLVEKLSLETALALYVSAVSYIEACNRSVYIIQHSEADINLCKKIKERFLDDHRVILLQENLNCLEYDLLIRQFDFIIASRYHALVHAYKQDVPCIAVGWSEKYNNLMETMKQDRYMLDARNFEKQDLQKKIKEMLKNFEEERKQIQHFFENMDEDLYDFIFKRMKLSCHVKKTY